MGVDVKLLVRIMRKWKFLRITRANFFIFLRTALEGTGEEAANEREMFSVMGPWYEVLNICMM